MDNAELVRRMQRALVRGGDVMTLPDLVELARAGRVALWFNDDAALAAEIITYPQKRIVNCFMGAGTINGIRELEYRAIELGREHDACALTVHGSRGWGRIGEHLGYRPESILFVKDMPR